MEKLLGGGSHDGQPPEWVHKCAATTPPPSLPSVPSKRGLHRLGFLFSDFPSSHWPHSGNIQSCNDEALVPEQGPGDEEIRDSRSKETSSWVHTKKRKTGSGEA